MKTKEEILQEFRVQGIREAASRVAAARGVAGTTIEAIAEEAGIAKGTIYLYFKNREELIQSLADHAFSSLADEVSGVFEREGGFRVQLEALILTSFRFFENDRSFFQLYRSIVEKEAGKCDHRLQHPQYQRYFRRLTEWIGQSIARGEVVALDAERLALVVSESQHAILKRRAQEESPPPADVEAAWLTRVLLSGLVP